MIALIDYITFVFDYIVDILSVKPFPDFDISIIQLILTCFVLKYIFKLFFGGMKEFDISTNWMNSAIVNQQINNHKRKQALSEKENKDSSNKITNKEKREIKKALKKFDKENNKKLGIK